jgi:hypothetical protein
MGFIGVCVWFAEAEMLTWKRVGTPVFLLEGYRRR